MALEKLEYPATGTVTESWSPTRNPSFAGAPRRDDLGIVTDLSAGNQAYNYGRALWTEILTRAYRSLAESEKYAFKNFARTVGADKFKFTDDRGIPWKAQFQEFERDYLPVRGDRYDLAFALRAELKPHPTLKKIPAKYHKDLLFYVPLDSNLDAFSRWDSAATFARAGTATYKDATTGLIKSAAANTARFETNGLLMERARTNSCLRSEEFDHAAWAKTTMTVAANDGGSTDPAGTNTAELLTATAANATIIQDLGVIASASKIYSIYLKRKTGTGDVQITLDNGVGWTTVTISSSAWTRVAKVQTLADPDVGIRLITNGDEIWAWGAQLENSVAYATSYIPTTSAAVTRNAETLTFTIAGHFLETLGSFFIGADLLDVDLSAGAVIFAGADDGDSSDAHYFETSATNPARPRYLINRASSAEADIIAAPAADDFVAATRKILAASFKSNDAQFYSSGANRGSDATVTLPAGLTRIALGLSNFTGHLGQLCVFARALTATEISEIGDGL